MRNFLSTVSFLIIVGCLLIARSPYAQEVHAMSLEAQRAEIDRIQARLSFLLTDVIRKNPEIFEQRARYSDALDREVDEILPEAPAHRARLAEVEQAYNAMLPNGDKEVIDQLFEEGVTLVETLQQARSQARKRPELVRQGRELRARFMALLAKEDSSAPDLLQRDQELVLNLLVRMLERKE
jgi:hypothetical protein